MPTNDHWFDHWDLDAAEYPILDWMPRPRTISRHCFETRTRYHPALRRLSTVLGDLAMRLANWADRVEERAKYTVPNPDYDPSRCETFPTTMMVGQSYNPRMPS